MERETGLEPATFCLGSSPVQTLWHHAHGYKRKGESQSVVAKQCQTCFGVASCGFDEPEDAGPIPSDHPPRHYSGVTTASRVMT